MLDNQYHLFASVLLVAAGGRSPLPPAEPPPDVVADMKGAVDIAKPYRAQFRMSLHSKTSSLFVVVNNLSKKLATRGGDESNSSHRDKRRASAKTSSAAYAGMSPRSNAATRFSISRAHAASMSEIGECNDSSKVSASWARSSATKDRACCSISSKETTIFTSVGVSNSMPRVGNSALDNRGLFPCTPPNSAKSYSRVKRDRNQPEVLVESITC